MTKKPKISICITNDIIYDRRIQRIAHSLRSKYEVKIFARKLFEEEDSLEGIEVKRIRCWFNRGFCFYMEYNIRLFFLLLRQHLDAIVAVDYDTLLPVRYASSIKNVKMIFDAHEYFEESVEITTRPRVKKFWKWVGRVGMKKVDLAYTVSVSISDIFSQIYGIPFHTIRNLPNKVENEEFSDYRIEKKVILYQGALNEGRKLELLINASAFLSGDYEIWLIGEGDLGRELRKRAESIESECKVVFHSWVRPSDLRAFTKQAYLAYNLLENRSLSYYYSLANKFFDYIHEGVPSLNSPFPEYQKINDEYGCCLIVDCTQAEELAEYILSLESNQKELESIRSKALIAAETLNWEDESLKLMRLYKDLLN